MTIPDCTISNIQSAQSEKDLGILLTDSLKFDDHIGVTADKANRITGLITCHFVYMDKELLYDCLNHL